MQTAKFIFTAPRGGHKLDAVRANDKVSFCVIDKNEVDAKKLTTLFKSVVVFGRAKIMSDTEKIKSAMTVFGLKYNNDVAAVEKEIQLEWNGLCCVEISIEHITGKQAIELMKKE